MAEIEEELIKSIIRGFNRMIILWLLSREPMSGYKILKSLREITGQTPHSGVVYSLLYELEAKGLIASSWTQRGRRRINYYSITDKGLAFLSRLREFFKTPVREVLENLLGEVDNSK